VRSPFDLGAKQMKDISLRILDMECAACVARLDRALEKLPGVQRAAVNYTAASALITYDERVTDLAAVAARVRRAGFRVPVEEQDLLPAEADAETAAAAAESKTCASRRVIARTSVELVRHALPPTSVDASSIGCRRNRVAYCVKSPK